MLLVAARHTRTLGDSATPAQEPFGTDGQRRSAAARGDKAGVACTASILGLAVNVAASEVPVSAGTGQPHKSSLQRTGQHPDRWASTRQP